jgi:hypothetical protein
MASLGALFEVTAHGMHVAWLSAVEAACERALVAVDGDFSRVLRESHPDHVEIIKVDGKPFRRVQMVMPGIHDESLTIRFVTTDLTTEPTE